jgi:hypothetical protein
MAQPSSPLVAAWLWIGLAVLALVLIYVFEWRQRPDPTYEDTDGAAGQARSTPAYRHDREMLEAPSASVESTRAISHEEFDPVGTAILIALYFLVVTGLWLFMYFVEFLGSGPTVVG